MSSPEWASGLSAAAASVRALLQHVDSTGVPLWSDESGGLTSAIYRYTKVFLPLRAAHLVAAGTLTITDPASRSELAKRGQKASRRFEKIYLSAVIAGAEWREQDGVFGSGVDLPDIPNTKARTELRKLVESWNDVLRQNPLPPVDVAFVWMLHRLSPADYRKDCERMFGCVIPADDGATDKSRVKAAGAEALDHCWTDSVDSKKAVLSRLQWTCWAGSATRTNGKLGGLIKGGTEMGSGIKVYWPTYLWPCIMRPPKDSDETGGSVVASFPQVPPMFRLPKTWKSPVQYDIVAAARRQKSFYFNICGSYYDSEKALTRGVERYSKFLNLMKLRPGFFLVPLYDIDLVWHAHICNTSAYKRDCFAVVGRFVGHKEDDDRTQGGELDEGSKTTAAFWREVYNEEYHDGKTGYVGAPDPTKKRVERRSKGAVIVNEDYRESFLKEAVCEDCTDKPAKNMERKCRKELQKQIQMKRVGFIQGGACGALHSRGIVGSISSTCTYGYAGCAGFVGDAGGAGCGAGTGACGSAQCGGPGGCAGGISGGGFVGGGGHGMAACGGGCGGGGGGC